MRRESFWFLLVLTVISGLIAELVHLGLRTADPQGTLPPLLTTALPGFLAGALFPYLVIRWVYRETLAGLGIRWWTPGKRSGLWLLATSGLTLLVWLAFWVGLLQLAGIAPEGEAVREKLSMNPLTMLMAGEAGPRVVAALVYFAVGVGFAEELFGRGLLQNVLDRSHEKVYGRGAWSVRRSTLLAALLFAWWHIEWLQSDPLAILQSIAISSTVVWVPSLVLCIVYERTRSMLVVIVLHNFIDTSKFVAWDWALRMF